MEPEEIKKIEKATKASVNFVWVICVLSVLLIVSIAVILIFNVCLIEYGNLMRILDLVATMLAITLSVFSILYSYNTSQDASRALSSVASEVAKIENTYTLIEEHMSSILNSQVRKSGEPDKKKDTPSETSKEIAVNNKIDTNANL